LALTAFWNARATALAIDASYGFDVGSPGKIRTNLAGTYVDLYDVTPIPNASDDDDGAPSAWSSVYGLLES
jgi:hypothetical protein